MRKHNDAHGKKKKARSLSSDGDATAAKRKRLEEQLAELNNNGLEDDGTEGSDRDVAPVSDWEL